MTLDPQLVIPAALTMAIGYTMFVSGLAKHGLERKRREADLPLLRLRHRRSRLLEPLTDLVALSNYVP